MNITIKNGGEYFNKGKACIWVELHDGTTHKFIIQSEDAATPEAPVDWAIHSQTQKDAVTKDLLAGMPLLDVELKYGLHRSEVTSRAAQLDADKDEGVNVTPESTDSAVS